MELQAIVSWVSFLAFVAVLALVVWRQARRVESVRDFFHSPEPRKNLISLVAASTSVGTGISYLLFSGYQNGLLMLLIPLAMLAGYLLLELFVSNVVPQELLTDGNYFANAKASIERVRNAKSRIFPLASGPLIFVFVLLFSYEIFVTSQLLDGFFFSQGSQATQFAISVMLFVVTLAFCYSAGVRAVFETDKLQFLGLVLLIGILLYASVELTGGQQRTATWLRYDSQTLTGVGFAAIAALTTQFYSLVNWYAISNLEAPAPRRWVLRTAPIVMVVLFGSVVVAGAIAPVDWSGGLAGAMRQYLAPFQANRVALIVLVACVIVGLASIILSTADTLMLSLTMYVHENWARANPGAARGHLQGVKRLLAGLFLIAFLLTAGLYYIAPNLFFFLLAIASGATVYAPLVILMGFLARQGRRIAVLSNAALSLYFVLFVSTMSFTLWATIAQQELVPVISLVHFGASVVLSLILFMVSRRYAHP
jgi:hypothetical protein